MAAPGPNEFRQLKEELKASQERCAQLEARDTQHGEIAKSFEARVRELEEEVVQLRKQGEELMASHQTRLEALRAAHQDKVDELRRQMKEANAKRPRV